MSDQLSEEFDTALDSLSDCVNGLLERGCLSTSTLFAMCVVLDKLIETTPQHNTPAPVRELQRLARKVYGMGFAVSQYIDQMDPKERKAAVQDARRNLPRKGQ